LCHLPTFLSSPPPPTATYTLSLHDALPIYQRVLLPGDGRLQRQTAVHGYGVVPQARQVEVSGPLEHVGEEVGRPHGGALDPPEQDRKSTRLNSSHVKISYAVFCLKKKKQTK